MNIGISTCSLDMGDGTLLNVLPEIKEAGFNLIEIDGHQYNQFPHGEAGFIKKLVEELDDRGIKLNSIHAPFHHNVSSPVLQERKQAVSDIITLMKNSRPLAENSEEKLFVIIHPGHHLTDTPAHIQMTHCRESLDEILSHTASEPYRVCVENMLSSHFGGKALELIELVEILGHDRLGICLDTSHAVYDSSPEEFVARVFNYLETTHISDNFNQPTGEYHAVPMTLRHSRVNWPLFLQETAVKLNRLILELIRPRFLHNDIFLKMARLSAQQMERYIQ